MSEQKKKKGNRRYDTPIKKILEISKKFGELKNAIREAQHNFQNDDFLNELFNDLYRLESKFDDYEVGIVYEPDDEDDE